LIYLDTNLVVALCAAERDSDRVESSLAAASREAFCISEWTCVEFTSAVGIKFRNRELSEALVVTIVTASSVTASSARP